MSFDLFAICNSCGERQEIDQLPSHPAGWERELAHHGWSSPDDASDYCHTCTEIARRRAAMRTERA